jgi:hypothetical protein
MTIRPLLSASWFGPALVAAGCWVAVVAAIDSAGSYPTMPEGPGLTVDEMFNVEQGVYLVEAVRQYGLGLLDARSVKEIFGQPPYLPDHPPLGRLWLGVHHHLAWAVAPPSEPAEGVGLVTACARTGSATALALTVYLVGWFAGATGGPAAGWLAAFFLALMPRVWGHAHIASLETVTNLTCTAAVLAVAWFWNKTMPPSVRSALLAGVLLGLAFLTKIQAVFLPLPIFVWTIWRWRHRAVMPLLIWGVLAATVFFVGWPWLWLDPQEHIVRYFASTTDRAALSVWYFGQKFADKAVPWHYPWVMFLTTMPIATLLLGACGLIVSFRGDDAGKARWLLAGAWAVPLLVFSLPGIAVYDGERLFLPVFPLWAVLAGWGASALGERSRRSWALGGAAAVLAVQTWQIVAYQPCWLSTYNLLVGGTSGAERLGLETTYWGDGVTRSLLSEVVNHVPAGRTVYVAPVLHPFQLDDLLRQSPALRRHKLRLVAYEGPRLEADYLLVFRRRADLPEALRDGPQGALLAETRRGGAQLAALYRLR